MTGRRSRSSSSARCFSRFSSSPIRPANSTSRWLKPPSPSARRIRELLRRVVVPGILPDLYRDQRILLGWAWTYLIVAELIGTTSGITWFITQQARYQHFANVYAAIIMIGIIGLGIDMILALLGRRLFPWDRSLAKSQLKLAMTPSRSEAALLPSYLDQSDDVRERFDVLKQRDVILKVEQSGQDVPVGGRHNDGARTISTFRHIAANFCAWSVRPAAASPLSFEYLAGLEDQTAAAQVLLDGKPVTGPRPRSRHGLSRLYAVSLADGQEECDVWSGSQGARRMTKPSAKRCNGYNSSVLRNSPTPTHTSCPAV